MMCVIGQLGWWGVPVGGAMFIGLVGPPGMIYRKIQRMKHRPRGGFFMEKAMSIAIPVKNHAIDFDVAMEVCTHEGLVRQAYKDSVGVWTWGPGITDTSGHRVKRYINNPQTMERCLEVYLWLLDKYADDVKAAFAGSILTKAQFAAALSFHWNTGQIKKASWVAQWKSGRVDSARGSFMAWKKPKEIIGRRKKERDLFFDGKWSSDGKVTEFTRVRSNGTPDWSSAKRVDIRPALMAIFDADAHVASAASEIPSKVNDTGEGKPMHKSTQNLSAVGGALTTAATAIVGLDPWLAALVVVIAAGFAFWIIKERKLKADMFGL